MHTNVNTENAGLASVLFINVPVADPTWSWQTQISLKILTV